MSHSQPLLSRCPLVGWERRRPHGAWYTRGEAGTCGRDVEPSPENVPTAGSWEGGAGRESLLIYLWPWHSPRGRSSPPEPRQMVFLGASSVSAATATCQENLDLSSSQEAMRGEGFGEAETLLGAGTWTPREGARLGLLVSTSVPRPLWPPVLQVQVLPLRLAPGPPPGGLSGSCPLDPFASVLAPHFLCLGPAA